MQWATLCKAFLLEARWFSCRHLQNSEEYLNNGFISSGVPVVLTHAFFLLGQDEDARAFVVHRISEEWKFLNQECLSASNPFSASFTKLALNVARMVPLMYDYNSQHSLPSLRRI
ncbi:hypothetical protein C1H46_010275 [Malus baccata]|uniref:Terpene synthase metal-binding domain-containing protein n=1 Tax=Malus baccata TaxID=106549 RepID=A0A540N0W9_MALBA|nr:hypothetical protein C1H46_010275 [Malus baccata]